MSRFYELLNKDGQSVGARALAFAQAPVDLAAPTVTVSPLSLTSEMESEMTKLVRRVFLTDDDSPDSVLFVPVSPSEDASLFCAAAAQVLASQTRKSVCAVDFDLASPSLGQRFGAALPPEPTGENENLEDALYAVPGTGLTVLGPNFLRDGTNPQPSLALAQKMSELRRTFDYVVAIAPTFATAPVVSLGGIVSGVIAVVEANSTRKDQARAFKQELKDASIPLLGALLNNRTKSTRETQYLPY